MKRSWGGIDLGSLRLLAVPIVLGLFACAPAGDTEAGETEEMADEGAESGVAMTESPATQEAPSCRFTASGEELTGRASPPDSASVQLEDGTVKLCYGAPSMGGREIMGGLVPYGEPWRLGANEPTTLHLPFAARVGTMQVEPGSYALYAIPGEAEWTIVLNSNPERWGIPIDEEVRANDVGSFTVQPQSLEEPVERLNIDLEQADEAGAATVVIEWATTRVSFPIRRAEG